jgi:hypothetical protein
MMRTIRVSGKGTPRIADPPIGEWTEAEKTMYQRDGVQMVLGGPVTQRIREHVAIVFKSGFVTGASTPEQGLVNYLLRGAYTPGMQGTIYRSSRTQDAKSYPTLEYVVLQEGQGWSQTDLRDQTVRANSKPSPEQYNALADGTELTEDELQRLARGLEVIVGWLLDFPMEPLMLAWASKAKRAGHDLNEDYRLVMCRYVLDMAQNILSGELKLTRESHDEYRLLMEFYWLLHKIPEYLLRTNSEGCAEGVMFTRFKLAGIRELWELMGGDQCAGVQTMKRRMILQLGELEKRGCVRIDQVWHIPTQLQVQAQTDRVIINLDTQLATTSLDMIKQAKFINANIQRAENWRQKIQSKAQGGEEEHKKREQRSPSVESTEIVGAKAAEKGKGKATERPTKRAKEEAGEKKPRLAKREVVVAHPDYMTVTPELWQKNKQKEGTYRYDYKSWKGVHPPNNPWLVRGSRGGAFSAKGLLWVRIPPAVEVCRRVSGTETRKSEAYEIYVPLPGDKVFRPNSMKGQ